MRVTRVRQAEEIVGGLSSTGKMPCKSISLPASACVTGAKLALIPGSACEDCYALKGRYRMSPVVEAMFRRMEALHHPQWVDAMVFLVKRQPHFRWFDSGDLQGAWHLENIIEVARQTPETQHWLPTKEYGLIRQYLGKLPDNLVVRVSSPMVDQKPLLFFPNTSTIHAEKPPQGHECLAPTQGGQCKDCRACWDRSVKNVSYKLH
jgi:hypothetical protein